MDLTRRLDRLFAHKAGALRDKRESVATAPARNAPDERAVGLQPRTPALERTDTVIGTAPCRYVVRRECISTAHHHGRRRLGELLELDVRTLAALADATPAPGPAADPHTVLFLDTETSGLSGGAGVYVFLTGLGRLGAHGFELEQWILCEPGGERAMLEALHARIAAASLVVSFGGRGFDERMLGDRFRLHGLENPIRRAHHADLGTLSRALWRTRMGSCRLGAIERAQLGHTRRDDLPGALCPSVYFAWLRSGEAAKGELCGLEPVLHHNRDDVLSLVTLTLELERRARSSTDAAELIGLGKHFRRRKRHREALAALERALGNAQALSAAERAELFAELGAARERLGDLEGAAAAWRALFALPSSPIRALIALAKLAEHRLRDLALAEQATVAALSRVRTTAFSRSNRIEAALTHRLARLERKKRRAQPPSSSRRTSGCNSKNRR